MTRRSIPAKKLDERTFAVRIRFALPENGMKRLYEMHEWLSAKAPKGYAIHATTAPRAIVIQFCSFLYMNDPALALECIKEFGLRANPGEVA